MAEIAELDAYRPHNTGQAKCLCCGNTWVAVAPTGQIDGLECQKCGTFKGVLLGLCNIENEDHWQCNCGCFVFAVAKASGIYCINCGVIQSFDER